MKNQKQIPALKWIYSIHSARFSPSVFVSPFFFADAPAVVFRFRQPRLGSLVLITKELWRLLLLLAALVERGVALGAGFAATTRVFLLPLPGLRESFYLEMNSRKQTACKMNYSEGGYKLPSRALFFIEIVATTFHLPSTLVLRRA